jgi:hypothetical protein
MKGVGTQSKAKKAKRESHMDEYMDTERDESTVDR